MNIPKLTLSILIVLLIGTAGSFFTSQPIANWYPTLEKPFFTPPNWLFGPAWTLLYTLIGITLFVCWENGFWGDSKLRNIFFLQLGLNFLWSPAFFGLQNPLAGLVDIILLDLAVIVIIALMFRHSRIALLMIASASTPSRLQRDGRRELLIPSRGLRRLESCTNTGIL